MKILMASCMDPGAPSGVRVHYETLAAGLRSRGHAVSVVTPASAPRFAHLLAGVVRRAGLVQGRVRRLVCQQAAYYIRMYFACRRAPRADVIHAHDVLSGAAARAATGGSAPVVVSCHFNGSPTDEIIRQLGWSPADGRRLARWYQRRFAEVDHYISTSEFVAARLRELRPGAATHRVVYNGIDFTATDSAAASRELGERFPGRRIVINAGWLEKRKNQSFVIHAAAAMPDDSIVFCLVGDGPDRGMLESAVAARKLGGRVVFLGQRSDLPALLKASHLCLHTAFLENCPLILLDAMSAGIPTLARDEGGVAELFPTTRAEAVIAHDEAPADVAARIRSLFRDAARCQALAAEQKRVVRETFSVEHMTTSIEAVYRELVRLPAS